MILTTERLSLKRVEHIDHVEILEYYIRNQAHLEPFEPRRSEHFYKEVFHQLLQENEVGRVELGTLEKYFVYQRGGDKIIGIITFSNIVMGAFKSCLLGYSIDHEFQGLGLMNEALEKLIKYMFVTRRLHRIEANVMPRNKRSSNLLKRLGFAEEGRAKDFLEINGQWEDHIRFSLLNSNEKA